VLNKTLCVSSSLRILNAYLNYRPFFRQRDLTESELAAFINYKGGLAIFSCLVTEAERISRNNENAIKFYSLFSISCTHRQQTNVR